MLSPPDAALAGRQSMLPGLATLLAPDILTRYARSAGLMAPDCLEACYIRFKPSTSCLVGYRVSGAATPPIIYATAFRQGSAKLAKASSRHMWPTGSGRGRITIDGEAIEVCAFPNDDHLKGLGELLTPGVGDRMLKHLLRQLAANDSPELRTLAYKPERRCVLLVNLDGRATAVIKVYGQRVHASAVRTARLMHSQGIVRVPRVVGLSSRRGLVAFEWVEGRLLAASLRSPQFDVDGVRETGSQLARLHLSAVEGLRQIDSEALPRKLREIVSTIGVLNPDLLSRASILRKRIIRRLGRLERHRAVVHGDFYAKQVIVSDAGPTFIDTDECAIGPPEMDLGNFIAHLHLGVLWHELDAQTAADARTALLDGYATLADRCAGDSISVWTAIGLLRVAHEPFRNHRPNWDREIEAILLKTEEVLAC